MENTIINTLRKNNNNVRIIFILTHYQIILMLKNFSKRRKKML